MSYPQQPYHGNGREPSPRENAGLVTLLAVGLPLLLLAGGLALFITLSGAGPPVPAEFQPLITGTANQAADRQITAQPTAPPQDTAPLQDTTPLQNTTQPQAAAQDQATAQKQPQSPQTTTQPSANGDVAMSKVGGTLTLRGSRSGLQVAVTLDRLIAAATPSSDFFKPKPGNKLVAVELSLVNRGQATYGDVPALGAQLIDAEGRQYRAGLTTVQEGQSFSGSVTISMGDTRKGVLVFELPQTANPARFQFAVDAGLSPQKGEWLLG